MTTPHPLEGLFKYLQANFLDILAGYVKASVPVVHLDQPASPECPRPTSPTPSAFSEMEVVSNSEDDGLEPVKRSKRSANRKAALRKASPPPKRPQKARSISRSPLRPSTSAKLTPATGVALSQPTQGPAGQPAANSTRVKKYLTSDPLDAYQECPWRSLATETPRDSVTAVNYTSTRLEIVTPAPAKTPAAPSTVPIAAQPPKGNTWDKPLSMVQKPAPPTAPAPKPPQAPRVPTPASTVRKDSIADDL
ncbi:uncharacterized protein LOC126779411 [Nymphalis io]|uniref:uncharacterized protein LOC126779411 n=1 Tax=Inachis io TaxID=171585 RepID=UPI002166C37B|nr:uncharacterized protein LOC126779411 [Nymphalis io]